MQSLLRLASRALPSHLNEVRVALDHHPDEVGAVGAVLHAATLEGAADDPRRLDVTLLSVGVETGGLCGIAASRFRAECLASLQQANTGVGSVSCVGCVFGFCTWCSALTDSCCQ